MWRACGCGDGGARPATRRSDADPVIAARCRWGVQPRARGRGRVRMRSPPEGVDGGQESDHCGDVDGDDHAVADLPFGACRPLPTFRPALYTHRVQLLLGCLCEGRRFWACPVPPGQAPFRLRLMVSNPPDSSDSRHAEGRGGVLVTASAELRGTGRFQSEIQRRFRCPSAWRAKYPIPSSWRAWTRIGGTSGTFSGSIAVAEIRLTSLSPSADREKRISSACANGGWPTSWTSPAGRNRRGG